MPSRITPALTSGTSGATLASVCKRRDAKDRLVQRVVMRRNAHSGGVPERANCHQICVSDGPNVGHIEGDQCRGSPGRSDELNIETARGIGGHDRAEVSGAQTFLRKIAGENNSIEHGVVHTYLGYTVTSWGASFFAPTIQTVTTSSDAPALPVSTPGIRYF